MPDLVLPDDIVSDSENRLPTCPLHIADDKGSGDSSRNIILFLEDVPFKDVPFNPNKFHPMRFHLEHINWSIWGTITWSNSFRRLSGYDAEKARSVDFRNLLTKTRSDVGLRGKDIFYYHATEYGKSGENHFHFLILNAKPLHVSHSLLAERMQYFWNKAFVRFDSQAKSGGSGLAVIAPYNKNVTNPAAQYHDGFLDAQTTLTNIQLGAVSNSYPFIIGAASTSGQDFGGSISDVRIYGRALSTNEVQQLYQYESNWPIISSVSQALCLNLTNLVAGGSYQLEASGNLFNWTNYGSSFVATSSNMTQYVNATANQGFFKVVPSP